MQRLVLVVSMRFNESIQTTGNRPVSLFFDVCVVRRAVSGG
jgi:hypothetical protein